MLKISDRLSANLVKEYWAAELTVSEGYFSESGKVQGEWRGQLASEWGLVGAVREEQYNRLADGCDPWDGTQLVRHRPSGGDAPKWMTDDKAWTEYLQKLFVDAERKQMPTAARELFDAAEAQRPENANAVAVEGRKAYREHIAAWDASLAPHKSVSVSALVGEDHRLVEAHKEAVRKAVDALEEYTEARVNSGLGIPSEKVVAAIFTHECARPTNKDAAPNPQLHSHVILFNLTEVEKRVRPVNPVEWFRVQSYISAVYQSELANRARELGYEIDYGRNYSAAIQGYSEEYLRAMSARTEEIEAEKTKRGVTGAAADSIINRQLRQPKEHWEPDVLKAEHKRQAHEYGQDPEAVVAQARARVAEGISAKNRAVIAHEGVSFAKDRLFEHQAVNDRYEIVRDALRYGLGYVRRQDVEHALDQRVLNEKREFYRTDHYRAQAPGERFTTSEMRRLEQESIEMALRGQGKMEPIAAGLTRDEFRERYKERTVEGKRITLNDSQMWMAFNVLTSKDQVTIVRGIAGAGKSTAIEPVGEVAEQHRKHGYDVIGLAATGAAANKLSEVGIRSETIQRHHLRSTAEGSRKRLYVVDEGSLVGTHQFHGFLKSLREQDRVIVLYDPRQHQSVEAGRIVEELEHGGVQAFRLEKIIRQQEAPELLEAVRLFAKGRTVEGLQMLEDQDRVKEVETREKRFEYMALHFARQPDTTVIASPDNCSIGELNQAVRKELQKQGKLGANVMEVPMLVPRREVRHADRMRAATYEAGDIVRFAKTSKVLGVKSGEYGRVVGSEAERNRLTIEVGGRQIEYSPKDVYGVEIFRPEKRALAIGERVQLTRPWQATPSRKVANREVGTLESVDEHGNWKLRLEDGNAVKWHPERFPHLDWAYASTSYSLQSRTAERVLLHLDTGDSTIRPLLDRALVYVGASRASHEVTVFTDSRERLLSDQSIVNREALKPKALRDEEIQATGARMTAVA